MDACTTSAECGSLNKDQLSHEQFGTIKEDTHVYVCDYVSICVSTQTHTYKIWKVHTLWLFTLKQPTKVDVPRVFHTQKNEAHRSSMCA